HQTQPTLSLPVGSTTPTIVSGVPVALTAPVIPTTPLALPAEQAQLDMLTLLTDQNEKYQFQLSNQTITIQDKLRNIIGHIHIKHIIKSLFESTSLAAQLNFVSD